MVKDDNDVSSAANSGRSHSHPLQSWHLLEPFEIGIPPEEWGRTSFDSTVFNWPEHLIQHESTDSSKFDGQQVAASLSDTGLDYELVNAAQPTADTAPIKHENTQSLDGGIEGAPDSARLAYRFRPEPSSRSVTVQPCLCSAISRRSSTLSSTPNPTPPSSSASFCTHSSHGLENVLPHLTAQNSPPSKRETQTLGGPTSENESHGDYSHFSIETDALMESHESSEQELKGSLWMCLSSPSINQAPLGILLDLGKQDHRQGKRKRDKDDAQSRTRMRNVRELGACLRCRMYKEKVYYTHKDLYAWLGEADISAVRPRCALWSLRQGCWKRKASQTALSKSRSCQCHPF